MVPESLRLESVLVILIDLAEGPLSSVGSIPQSELRRNAGVLAELCLLLEIPVIVAKAPLPPKAAVLLPEVSAHVKHFTEVDHATNDSWETPAFVDAVRTTGRRQLVFAGIATDVGVGLTALSALRAGYQAAVLTDVSGTVNARAEATALIRLAQAGVILSTWSAFAGEIQRDYSHGKGPDLLKLVARSLFEGTGMSSNNKPGKPQQS